MKFLLFSFGLAIATSPIARPSCCPTDVFVSSTGRALFNPPLDRCPKNTEFICSVATEDQTAPTKIVINGKTIVTGEGGTNSFVDLFCLNGFRKWITKNLEKVDSISCQ